MAGNFNDNYITNFSFEYYGGTLTNGVAYDTNPNDGFVGDPVLTINLYANTGPLVSGFASPAATPFWTYSTLAFPGAITPTPGGVFSIGVGDPDMSGILDYDGYIHGIHLPTQEFTFTISFSGLGAGDLIGLTAVPGSDIGTVFTGYWVKTPGGDFQYLQSSTNNSANAEVQVIPEPSSLALVGIGGLALIGAAKRRFTKQA